MAGYFGDSYSSVQNAALNDNAQLQAQYARTMANLLGVLGNRRRDRQYEDALTLDKERYGDKLRSNALQEGFESRKLTLAEQAAKDRAAYEARYLKMLEDQQARGGLTPAQQAAQDEQRRQFALTQSASDAEFGLLPEPDQDLSMLYSGLKPEDVPMVQRRFALVDQRRGKDYDESVNAANTLNKRDMLNYYIQQSEKAKKDAPGNRTPSNIARALTPAFMRAAPYNEPRMTEDEIAADIKDWQTELGTVAPQAGRVDRNDALLKSLKQDEWGRYSTAYEPPRSRQVVPQFAPPTRVPVGGATSAIPRITSKDEYDALNSGDTYIGKDGRIYRKP